MSQRSLLPFHGFSPVLKSLRVQFMVIPSSCIFNLILSFPLLENLAVVALDTSIDIDDGSNGLSTVIQPPNSPAFTGSLELFLRGGMEHIARRLLFLPGGIHFRKLTLTWFHERDLSLTMVLVERCSCALEYPDITCNPLGTPVQHPLPHLHLLPFPVESGSASIDLSKATRLKRAVFQARSLSADWITVALRTITPKHRGLRRISIHLYFDSVITSVSGANVGRIVGEQIIGQWLELDHFLAQFWESHAIRPGILHHTPPSKGDRWARECVGCLVPETTAMGIIDLTGRVW